MVLDVFCQFLEYGAGGSSASRAGGYFGREGPQAQRLQYVLRHAHFQRAITAGFRCQRDPDRVANALLQKDAHGGGRCDDAFRSHASFGQPEMQGIGAALCER